MYDVLKILFTMVESEHRALPRDLLYYRPREEKLEELCGFASMFFNKLSDTFKPLRQFFTARNFEKVVAKYRGDFGGNLIFRPIGLTIIVRVIAEMTKEYSLDEAIHYASWLPLDLDKPPLANVIWDTSRKAMNKPSNEALARKLCLYMLGYECDEKSLANAYTAAIGDPGNTQRFYNEVYRVVEV